MKKQSGITLIGLVITIIVLLILAGVSISMVVGNNGVLTQSSISVVKTREASAIEEVSLAWTSLDSEYLGAWANNTTLKKEDYFTIDNLNKYLVGKGKVTYLNFVLNGTSTLTYRSDSDNTDYDMQIDTYGNVTIMREGILLNKSQLVLEIEEGETATGEITARLKNISGEISWTNSDDSVATLSAATGETITVTAVGKGTTTITADCEGYTAVCTVKVSTGAELGSFIRYNVPYADVYLGYEYDASNGWRYLGKDSEGNHAIISTGIPAKLGYKYNNSSQTWWFNIDINTIESHYGIDLGNYWSSENSAYWAAYAMKTKLSDITLETKSGSMKGSDFLAGGGSKVTILGLDDDSSIKDSVLTIPGNFKWTNLTGQAAGIYDLADLSKYDYNSFTDWSWWLGSPSPYAYFVYDIKNSILINSLRDAVCGIRPVVILSSDIDINSLVVE